MTHEDGSPPGKLSAIDWRSIAWTLATAAAAAALTSVIDLGLESVLPALKDSHAIDGALFTFLTTVLHGLRKLVTDTRLFIVRR